MTFLGLEPRPTTALLDAATGEALSYNEIMGLGNELGVQLGGKKQLVLLAAQRDVFSLAVYWGAINAGHAVALLNGDDPAKVLADLAETYQPTWIAGPSGLGARLAAVGMAIEVVGSFDRGELIRYAASAPVDVHPDLALMLTTSGSTGSGKFVRLSQRNLESNAASIAACLELAPDDRPITSLPIHYSFGLSVLNSHWSVGATVVLSGAGVLERRFWDGFEETRCTSLAGVPYTYQMLERVGFRQMELPSLRSLQQAGGALDLRLTQLYSAHQASRGGRFFVMYGQTEATARIAYVPPDRIGDKAGSAGLAIPGGKLRISMETDGAAMGRPGPRTTGEVIYEGPNVMMGYASTDLDLGRGDDLGGVLHTGDIGYLDEEGYLFLVGRSKRIAKIFGNRVNLDEVEALVSERGPAAVVGSADTLWAFCAFGTDESVELLAREVAQRLRLHHSGLRFRHVEEIPITASGKVDYREIERWVG